MKFAAVAALVASASAYSPTVEQILIEAADGDAAPATLKDKAKAAAETEVGTWLINNKTCKGFDENGNDDAHKALVSCVADRKNTIVYTGNQLIAGITDKVAECKDKYEKVTENKNQATVQTFFDCTAQKQKRTMANAEWKLAVLKNIPGGETLAKQGEKFCEKTKA